MKSAPQILVIGAGVGGLTLAAALARTGLDVTVLEAHVYPGGCAGTFFHQGYRFDAGATLAAGFYPGGPMDRVAQAVGIDEWSAFPDPRAMVVHLPDGRQVTRWGNDQRHAEYAAAFPAGESFWRWQETTADALWTLANQSPPWPPQSAAEWQTLISNGLTWLPQFRPNLLFDAFQSVASHLPDQNADLRLFVDAQLLIAAQVTSTHANALYGAAALDLPRRGVVHLPGGIGTIASSLAAAVEAHGGHVHYRQTATQIQRNAERGWIVRTKRGGTFTADRLILNLPPGNINELLGDAAPPRIQHEAEPPSDGWGAFMTYVGALDSEWAADRALHHQVILREPLGEGNTVFLSLSPAWDATRAPAGHRALTISTHTRLGPWWQRFQQDRAGYEARKQAYSESLRATAERALPGLQAAVRLVKPGTPITFQRFTRRRWGWVGGFPQTHLLRGWAPRLAPNLWMVGDSIFPGQSTAAVALGGLRVARAVIDSL